MWELPESCADNEHVEPNKTAAAFEQRNEHVVSTKPAAASEQLIDLNVNDDRVKPLVGSEQLLTLADLKVELRSFARRELEDVVKRIENMFNTHARHDLQFNQPKPVVSMLGELTSGGNVEDSAAAIISDLPICRERQSTDCTDLSTDTHPRLPRQITAHTDPPTDANYQRQASGQTSEGSPDRAKRALHSRHLQGFVKHLEEASNYSSEDSPSSTRGNRKRRPSLTSSNISDPYHSDAEETLPPGGDAPHVDWHNNGGNHIRVKDTLGRILHSAMFERTIVILIVASAALLGVQVNSTAEAKVFDLADFCLCVLFTVEYMFRVIVHTLHGKRCWSFLFQSRNWCWNLFDTILLGQQIVDAIVTFALWAFFDRAKVFNEVNMLYAVRCLRLASIFRVVRIIRFGHPLRTIWMTITNSFGHILWTIVALCLLMYVYAVFFAQSVAIHIQESQGSNQGDVARNEVLHDHFGSAAMSLLTLFECITGGVDWRILSSAMIQQMSPIFAIILCSYICIVIFGVLNQMNGIFVEAAIREASRNKDVKLLHLARELFASTDMDADGKLTWQEFEMQLDTEEMKQYFEVLDLDIGEADTLFQLVDADGSGEIDSDEFVNGCFRLRGAAKAVEFAYFYRDFEVMRSEVSEMAIAWKLFLKMMENIEQYMGQRTGTQGWTSEATVDTSPPPPPPPLPEPPNEELDINVAMVQRSGGPWVPPTSRENTLMSNQ